MLISLTADTPKGISDNKLFAALAQSLEGRQLKKVLLIPPDFTRFHSGAGKVTNEYYKLLKDKCQVDILPALGTHVKMTPEECAEMFGDIPYELFIEHKWRTDIVKLGEVPADFVSEVSEGLVNEPISVEVNRLITDKSYDLIISIGQVVPHEVVGMANYSKNIFVGCGGSDMINSSHMLGAVYGMERVMGKDHSPVRKVFDYAQKHFLADLPLIYVLTVTTAQQNEIFIHGLFIGNERSLFEQGVASSQQKNLTFVEKPFEKVVVFLDPKEFKSTWLGNKAIYRTRMAIADDGELIILAPGVNKFGEDSENDRLIRKYGYVGRINVLKLTEQNEDLKNNLSVAAHLIHGSSDDRFSITYCTKHLTEREVTDAAFSYIPYDEVIKRYNPALLKDGHNTLPNGERIYYISNPALGLWVSKEKF
ncbi:MAG: lactate racemase domain-containing protein [Firmicutes bacterium]|nr:lactate racemase domain-containing protein [Bacillota bacterium]